MPQELLDIRGTLIAGRDLHRTLSRLSNQYPLLSAIAARIVESAGVIAEIGRCIDERGEVRDEASPHLETIRRELRLAHDRLQDKLARILTSPRNGPYLQEAIITMRDGRYVVPIKADFKGRIPGIVHDQSRSGETLFIEPIATVELNNRWRELQLAGRKRNPPRAAFALCPGGRRRRVRRRHGRSVGRVGRGLCVRQVRRCDRGDRAEDRGFQEPRETLTLARRFGSIQARHPLIDPQRVVPIDVEMDDETFIVVITGPNTGGKTVALKTVGLLCLMAYCGLHIPAADGSELCVFDHVFADIGDEQSIEQSLSTFSSHLANLNGFLDKAERKSLVLLDELGAGTDPAEGSALARAILDYLRGASGDDVRRHALSRTENLGA